MTCHVESGLVLGLARVIFQVESGVHITDHLNAVDQPRRRALAVRSHSRRFSVGVYFFMTTSVGVCYSSEEALWQYGLSAPGLTAYGYCIFFVFFCLLWYLLITELHLVNDTRVTNYLIYSVCKLSSRYARNQVKFDNLLIH